jgi:hypothetical protein
LKRFGISSLMLLIAVSALAAAVVRAGIDLHRRAFTAGEIVFVVGVSITVGTATVLAGIALWRRRRARSDGR